jgi:hypothetical protein
LPLPGELRFMDMYGTPDYIAPQVINRDCNLNAISGRNGVVFFEVLSGLLPAVMFAALSMTWSLRICINELLFDVPFGYLGLCQRLLSNIICSRQPERKTATARQAWASLFLKEARAVEDRHQGCSTCCLSLEAFFDIGRCCLWPLATLPLSY